MTNITSSVQLNRIICENFNTAIDEIKEKTGLSFVMIGESLDLNKNTFDKNRNGLRNTSIYTLYRLSIVYGYSLKSMCVEGGLCKKESK